MKQKTFEEIINAITHGIGAGLSIAALVLLIIFSVKYGTVWHIVSFSIYGSSLILLYLMSTLFHGITHPKSKNVFEKLDHSMIFVLIAGTYTPFALTILRGVLGWTIFGIVWALAIMGILLKSIFNIKKYDKISLYFYLIMGWLIIIGIKPLIMNFNKIGLVLLVLGGIFYSAGTIFYIKQKPYFHNIWHIFVLAGSILHFFAVLNLLN